MTGRKDAGRLFRFVVRIATGGLPMVAAFRTNPRPDSEVVELLERALAEARKGRIRTVSIVAVNPLNEAERLLAGELTPSRTDSLIGGLVKAVHKVAAIHHS